MSATNTSSTALKQNGLSGRSWLVGILTILTAVIMNTVILLVAHAALTVAPTFVPLQFTSALPATVVAVTGALIVFALLSRQSQQPVRLFRRIAVVVLIISIIPDLLLPFTGWFADTTLPEVGFVLLMHVATALLCIAMAPRLLASRP